MSDTRYEVPMRCTVGKEVVWEGVGWARAGLGHIACQPKQDLSIKVNFLGRFYVEAYLVGAWIALPDLSCYCRPGDSVDVDVSGNIPYPKNHTINLSGVKA